MTMVSCHVIVGLFETIQTVGVAMTTHVVKEPYNNNLIEPSSKLHQMVIKN
jgi:hypothetical protein